MSPLPLSIKEILNTILDKSEKIDSHLSTKIENISLYKTSVILAKHASEGAHHCFNHFFKKISKKHIVE